LLKKSILTGGAVAGAEYLTEEGVAQGGYSETYGDRGEAILQTASPVGCGGVIGIREFV
jgi:hypothetical protein